MIDETVSTSSLENNSIVHLIQSIPGVRETWDDDATEDLPPRYEPQSVRDQRGNGMQIFIRNINGKCKLSNTQVRINNSL